MRCLMRDEICSTRKHSADNQYPLYGKYKHLTGQFLPQETALIWLWGTITGSRKKLEQEVYRSAIGEGIKPKQVDQE